MKRRQFLCATAGTALAASLSKYSAARADDQKLAPADVTLTNGAKVTLQGAMLEELRDALHGRLLLPLDDGYDDARRVVNRRIDKHPAFIVQATGAADVGHAIDFARTNRLLLAVKCGGHNDFGISTCDGGMMLDLSPMRGVRIDAKAKRAWVSGGTLLGLIDHEAAAQGLIAPLGDQPTVGIGGLATGGGFGRLSRRFGLTLDTIRSVDVVAADGKLMYASSTDNPDLFWGIRGGGGNFGVVTNFELELHSLPTSVVAGTIIFPLAQARQVLTSYAEYASKAPDELYVECFIGVRASKETSILRLGVCYSGDEASAERVLRALRGFGQVIQDDVRAQSYVAAQGSNRHSDPRAATSPTTEAYTRAGFVEGIDAGLIAAIVAISEPQPARHLNMLFQPAGGAIARVANRTTAFAHRSASHDMILATNWLIGADGPAHLSYSERVWQALEPHTRGFYTNDMAGAAAADAIAVNFGENYRRLAALKSRDDSGNLFKLNANIVLAAPGVGGGSKQ